MGEEIIGPSREAALLNRYSVSTKLPSKHLHFFS